MRPLPALSLVWQERSKQKMTIRGHTPKVEERLFETEVLTVSWLIELRWIAFVMALIFCIVGIYIFKSVEEKESYAFLAILTLLIGLSNVIFYYLSKKNVPERTQLFLQIGSDLVLLTIMLHFSGGAENPLLMLYVFHIFISSILFPKKDAYIVTAFACICFVSLVILEYMHILPHYTLKFFPHYEGHHASHDVLYSFGISGVFVLVMFVSAFFATSLAETLRAQIAKQKQLASQLVQAAKMSAIGEIAGNIAHEINNPIGIIIMKTKMLLSDYRKKLSQKVIKDLQKIDLHSGRIENVVKGLLSFARPSLKIKELVDINSVIESSLQLIQSRLEVEHITLKSDLEDNLPKVMANFNELQQVIVNIINNAADAMPDGGWLRIRTSTAQHSKKNSGSGIKIEITDTGKGISPEDIDKIFTPFYSTKGKQGTGLGLSICAGIISVHKGKIWVKSELGKGSTFHIFLPLDDNLHDRWKNTVQ